MNKIKLKRNHHFSKENVSSAISGEASAHPLTFYVTPPPTHAVLRWLCAWGALQRGTRGPWPPKFWIGGPQCIWPH